MFLAAIRACTSSRLLGAPSAWWRLAGVEFTMLTCRDCDDTGEQDSGGLESTRGVLRVFRIVRILRVVVILNKIKRARRNPTKRVGMCSQKFADISACA